MRTLKEGGSEHSFGIHVAQMAGMPNPIVLRAAEIMSHLEKDKSVKEKNAKLASVPKSNFQLQLFEMDPKLAEAKKLLDELDINTISPIEALLKLHELKKKMELTISVMISQRQNKNSVGNLNFPLKTCCMIM